MSESATGKIQSLLEQAARQADSPIGEGSSINSATRIFPTAAEVEKAFNDLREKLFHIEHWNECSGVSSFELFDKDGNSQPEKKVADGDFIKITLPGSGKSDWVKIIEIYNSPDEVVLVIQPSLNPTDAESKETTSHFFTGDSTNNFCLQRKNAKIIFYVIGLNEKTNTQDTNGILETVRNFATSSIGHYFGIQKAQWKTFCENFLKIKN